ncbi:chaperone activator [Moniliophthora roreri]|nr:chaperone activator [Moniliophthora roreri]
MQKDRYAFFKRVLWVGFAEADVTPAVPLARADYELPRPLFHLIHKIAGLHNEGLVSSEGNSACCTISEFQLKAVQFRVFGYQTLWHVFLNPSIDADFNVFETTAKSRTGLVRAYGPSFEVACYRDESASLASGTDHGVTHECQLDDEQGG